MYVYRLTSFTQIVDHSLVPPIMATSPSKIYNLELDLAAR